MTEEFATEPYVLVIYQKTYRSAKSRSAYAKFRNGVAPIKIDTGRYGANRVLVEERLCETCKVVEDEYHVLHVLHVLLQCQLYHDLRTRCLYANMRTFIIYLYIQCK